MLTLPSTSARDRLPHPRGGQEPVRARSYRSLCSGTYIEETNTSNQRGTIKGRMWQIGKHCKCRRCPERECLVTGKNGKQKKGRWSFIKEKEARGGASATSSIKLG